MRNSPLNMKNGKQMLNSDLRYFKGSTVRKPGLACDTDVTSFSSNASMHYRKFSAEALVLKALKGLAEPKGSTVVAIKKFIINHYPYVDGKFTMPVIRRILRNAIHNGKVVLAQGSNMEGLFKISADEVRASQQKQKSKQIQACLELRAQQKRALEERIRASREKEEQRRQLTQQNRAVRLKRQKDNEAASKAAKAKLTQEAAREMLVLLKKHPVAAAALITQPDLRLKAGNSKSLLPKPQIVDYADAAIETAKVISSEEMKKAIIKAAEYAPKHLPLAKNNTTDVTPRSMAIKYERTLRSPTLNSLYPSNQKRSPNSPNSSKVVSQECPKLKEIFKKKVVVTKSKMNSLPSSQKQAVYESSARKKNVPTAKNVRKVTKRMRPKATTTSASKQLRFSDKKGID